MDDLNITESTLPSSPWTPDTKDVGEIPMGVTYNEGAKYRCCRLKFAIFDSETV